jgi:hypothetical protein
MNGVNGRSAKGNERGNANANESMYVEQGWGTNGTNVDDGVGWRLGPGPGPGSGVSGGMGRVWRGIGGAIGGMFRPRPPYELKWVEVRKWGWVNLSVER